ncbi:hypothetical protein [Mycobacteroides franklinii]|uniref:hypothetical protein n=1 Tax=Mycobacteroides franklinii TaxID=948102 RepID=UPI00177EC88F|nr:hypothetical protein [Mycobacteroides franklinii]
MLLVDCDLYPVVSPSCQLDDEITDLRWQMQRFSPQSEGDDVGDSNVFGSELYYARRPLTKEEH